MSDHDAANDPIDRAYAQAEAMLDDEAARAARRARVLGAVAADAAAAPVAPPTRRVPWAAGAWLAAASVAGVSALVAWQLSVPPIAQRTPPPAQAPVAAAPILPAAPAPAQEPAPTPPPAAKATPPAPPAFVPEPVISPSDIVVAPPPPSPAVSVQPAAAPPPAPSPPPAAQDASEGMVESLVVTGQKRQEDVAPNRSGRMEAPSAQAPAPATPTQIARLHAAAAAGRISELRTLLARGVPVDAPDSDGETALMKAIQSRQPGVAGVLRRNGASLDRVNRAGVSAREMAAQADDAGINRALGLEP